MRVMRESRWTKTAKAALSISVSLGLAAASPLEAMAQRRRAEQESAPELQAQPAPGGGPVESEPAAPSGGAQQAEPEEQAAPASRPDVQIGASVPERAAPRPALAPLDNRVTVRVKGAPLSTFLDTISAQSRINFIIT